MTFDKWAGIWALSCLGWVMLFYGIAAHGRTEPLWFTRALYAGLAAITVACLVGGIVNAINA